MYPTISPHLIVNDVGAAVEFYVKAFGAEATMRFSKQDGPFEAAELRIGNTLFTVGEALPMYQTEAPDPKKPVHVPLTWFCPDVDAAFARAVEAGAIVALEPADYRNGDRTAVVRCPFGHRWVLVTRVHEPSLAEQHEAFRTMIDGES